jgi:hypothetical protein
MEDDRTDLSLSLGNEDGTILVHEKLRRNQAEEQALIERRHLYCWNTFGETSHIIPATPPLLRHSGEGRNPRRTGSE